MGEWALTGRDEELAVLEGTLSSGAACGAVLVGRAGSGKSRLAREVARRRERAGGRVVRCQGTVSAATIALGAVAHLLPPASQRGPDQLSAFQAVAAQLRGPGEVRTLVVLDDAHLFDEATAALALHLAVTGSAELLVCVRAGEPAPDAVTALWKDDHLRRVDLQALSDAEVALMLTGALPGSVATEVVRWVQERSLGLPLFAVELVRGAVSEGVLRRRGDEWSFACPPRPPQRMRELIEQRLAGLTPREREGLQVLAFGEPLSYQVALGVIGEAPLERLEQHGLAQTNATGAQPRQVGLVHPLYGEVALAGIAGARRDAIARRLASVLLADDRCGSADVLRAVRWRLEVGDPVGVAERLRAAAAAAAMFDPSLALEHAREAHALAGDVTTALAMASPLVSLARFSEVEALLARYQGQEDGEEQAAMVLGLRGTALQLGLRRTSDALALLDRYAGAYRSPSWRRRVRNWRIGVMTHAGHLLEAAELLREMLEDPASTGEDFRHSYSGTFALLFAGDARAAGRFAERVLSSPDGPSADPIEVLTWTATRLEAGHGRDRLEAVLEAILSDALERDNVVLAGVCAFLRGRVALESGRVATAQKKLEQALPLLGAQDPFAMRVSGLAMLAEVRALQRDVTGARRALDGADEVLAYRPPTWVEEAGAVRARMRIALADDRPVEAQRTALEAALRMGQVLKRRATLLHEALRAGAPAAQVARGLEQIAARSDLPMVQACADHAAASADRDAERLERAAERFRRIGALLHAAEAEAEAAAAFAARGQRPRAVEAAERSRRLAERCEGAWTPMLRLADAATHNLTAREAEVAALAGRGLTNAQIAERLVLSARTVDSHMQRIYGKLGINRRQRLADILPLE